MNIVYKNLNKELHGNISMNFRECVTVFIQLCVQNDDRSFICFIGDRSLFCLYSLNGRQK